MIRLRLAKITFEERITQNELQWFRGVMIRLSDNNQLFHNHLEKGFKYSYPKIQYKIIDGHPAVLGIGAGAVELLKLFAEKRAFACYLGNKEYELNVASIQEWYANTGITTSPASYAISNWLPLNNKNYNEYRSAGGLVAKTKMLEKILTGNILSFAKGIGLFFDSKVECIIEDFETIGNLEYKGVSLMSFSAKFKSNVLLPQWIGLGKSSSLNHGTLIHK